MNHDLQIEDLVAQNEADVVFRAIHAGGHPVVLRRFFPFGVGGGGLRDGEGEVFETVVRRLLDCRHPALCPVVAGGVDPVDGIPFVALERLPGDSLEAKLRHGPLPPRDAIEMLESLPGAAGVVSTALGRDGLWLETESRTIQWADRGHGPAPVFRIAPYRCLWTGEDWRPAAELIRLTEVALGWHGVMVADQAAEGLGAWMRACGWDADGEAEAAMGLAATTTGHHENSASQPENVTMRGLTLSTRRKNGRNSTLRPNSRLPIRTAASARRPYLFAPFLAYASAG